MEPTSRISFPYSKNVLNMPKGPERKAAQARERARAYHLRTRKVNTKPKIKLTRKSPNKPIVVENASDLEVESHIIPNSISFSEPIPLAPFLEKARRDMPTVTKRTIYGEACEIFSEKYLPCKQCNNKSWTKAKKNQKAYDLTCNICGTRYQIKGSKTSHIKPKTMKCEIMCGRFPGVFECHKNTRGLDYYLFTYSETHIKNIFYVNHKGICADTNLFKNPVKAKIWTTAKNYCTIKLDKDKCEQIM
jgi:hypothetical protein